MYRAASFSAAEHHWATPQVTAFALTSFDSRLLHSMRCAHVHIGPKTHWYISLSMLLLCYTVFSFHRTKEWKREPEDVLFRHFFCCSSPPSTPPKMHWNYHLAALPYNSYIPLGASWTRRGKRDRERERSEASKGLKWGLDEWLRSVWRVCSVIPHRNLRRQHETLRGRQR